MSESEIEARKSIMDGEHRMQFGLIRALQEAVDAGEGNDTVEAILQQLIDYSEAHFLSEELLMRLASYDDYEDHAANHEELLESFRNIQRQFQSTGRLDMVSQVSKSCTAFLVRHIQTSDVRFANWERV